MIILNFHGVGPMSRPMDAGERSCWLDYDRFEKVLGLIPKTSEVRITADDGNVSDYEIVLPALLERGLRAAFFVCSGRIDKPGFLSRTQVCELQQNGMEIGSHGIAHVSWRGLAAAKLALELEGSRKALEDVCGKPVESAACPFGEYDRAVLSGLKRAGFRRAYSSDDGIAAPGAWLQSRTTITRDMPLDYIRRLIDRGPGMLQQMSISCRTFLKRMR